MRKSMVVASLLMGLVGCGSKDGFDDMLGKLEGFKNQMCACKDTDCADKVQDEWRAYRREMKDKMGKDKKPSEAQDKKGKDLSDAMRACRRELRKSDEGGAPDAE